MTNEDVIRDYLYENYGNLKPKYYDMRREYFMEYSWIHFACAEILQCVESSPISAKETLYMLYDEASICLLSAKSQTSRSIFETEQRIINECLHII